MKLGVLGIDEQIAWVVEAARRGGDAVILVSDLPDHSPHLACLDPESVGAEPPRSVGWEALLDPRSCDAVLVGRDGWNDTRAEAVRKLVQAGRLLVLSQPLTLSMLWAYELDMIRKDTGARLIPTLPDRRHPFIALLKQKIETALATGIPGAIESILLERRMADRSREEVLGQFARDVDLVRALVGDPGRLSTLSGADAEAVWSTLAVGLTGPDHIPVRWQVQPGEPTSLRLSLVGARDSMTLDIPASGSSDWTLSSGNEPPLQFDRGAEVMRELHAAFATTAADPVPHKEKISLLPVASWDDASRAIELAETIPRSVAKARAIDLHQEEFTELGTFKGTMASLGCGIVLAALLLLVLATLVGGIARETGWDFGERLAGVWPVIVLAVLGLFLLLQTLPLLISPQTPSPPPTPPLPPPPFPPQPHSPLRPPSLPPAAPSPRRK